MMVQEGHSAMSVGGVDLAVFCWGPAGILGLLFCHELGQAVPILLRGG
jgi:hypothetical protein